MSFSADNARQLSAVVILGTRKRTTTDFDEDKISLRLISRTNCDLGSSIDADVVFAVTNTFRYRE